MRNCRVPISIHRLVNAFTLAAFSVAIACGSSLQAQDSTESQAVKDVLAAFEKTKTAQTTADYTAIIELVQQARAGDLPKERVQYAQRLLGWALNRRGESQLAAVETALAEKKDDEAKRLEAAATADFEAALKADPDHWKALHNRGVNFAQAGKFELALADFNRALELNSKYANTWFNRGEIRLAQGAFEQAVADYDQAVELGPQDAFARISRGDAHFSLAQWDRANADYRRAVALDPANGRAHECLARLLATCPEDRYRDAAAALDAARRAVELSGENHQTLEAHAAALANAGRFEEAQATIAKALTAAPAELREPLKQRQTLYAARRPFRQGATTPGRTP